MELAPIHPLIPPRLFPIWKSLVLNGLDEVEVLAAMHATQNDVADL